MLDRNVVFALVAHVCGQKGCRRIASRFCCLLKSKGAVTCAIDVSNVRFFFILHAYQRGCKARSLGILGQHQCNRLPIEHDLVVIEWAER